MRVSRLDVQLGECLAGRRARDPAVAPVGIALAEEARAGDIVGEVPDRVNFLSLRMVARPGVSEKQSCPAESGQLELENEPRSGSPPRRVLRRERGYPCTISSVAM
jgi:hypothetical protein